MYRFRFGTLFSLLDELRIKSSKHLSSKVMLFETIVDPKIEGGITIHKTNVSSFINGKDETKEEAIENLNSLSIDELANLYAKVLLPHLLTNNFKLFILAIKDILKSDISISSSTYFFDPSLTKKDIIDKTVFHFPKLLACLVKYCASVTNKKNDNEELLPEDFIMRFTLSPELKTIQIVQDDNDMEVPLTKSVLTSDINIIFKEIHPSEYLLNISNANRFKVFILDIYNKSFDTDKLERFIVQNIGSYVYSRTRINDYKNDTASLALLGYDAVRELKHRLSSTNKTDLFSQIMIYSFLETSLHAYKLYSAYEIENLLMGNNKKVSGVYLLPKGSNEVNANQFVFGSSNINNSIKTAIDNVLEIAKAISLTYKETRRQIDSSIIHRNDFNKETINFLKKVLMPNKYTDNEVLNAFGIFFSYSVDFSNITTNNVEEVKREIENKINEDIRENLPYIEQKIKASDLDNYPFYFFVLPLVDAEKVSSDIIDNMIGVK